MRFIPTLFLGSTSPRSSMRLGFFLLRESSALHKKVRTVASSLDATPYPVRDRHNRVITSPFFVLNVGYEEKYTESSKGRASSLRPALRPTETRVIAHVCFVPPFCFVWRREVVRAIGWRLGCFFSCRYAREDASGLAGCGRGWSVL